MAGDASRCITPDRNSPEFAAARAGPRHPEATCIRVMSAALSGFNLGTVLLASIVLFPLACLFFGTRGGYYNTDKYDGNGTAH